ncbi:MAG: hypothetical protein ACRCZR_07895 [Cetobacterium sp.]
MNKLEILSTMQNLKLEDNYSWEIYLFNIDKRLTGSPYKISKLNFKGQNNVLNYGKHLVECIEKYQFNDEIIEIQNYCVENPKISCDKLDLNDEIIKTEWNYLNDCLNSAVVDSKDNLKVKGYIVCAKPKKENLKKFIFVKKANPIVQGDKKKSKSFKMGDDDTLDSFNEKIFRFYLNTDFFIVDSTLYTFNHSFQEIFKMEKTFQKIKDKTIEKIMEKSYFKTTNEFLTTNLKNITSKMYFNFDIEKLNRLDDPKNRKNIAKILDLKLNQNEEFEFKNIDEIKDLIKYLSNRIITEEGTKNTYVVSGHITKK